MAPVFSGAHKNIFLAMKMTIFLLFMALAATATKITAQKVTFSGKQLSLAQVFTAIEKQTGYVIMANEGVFDGARLVAPRVTNMPLNELLDLVLKNQGIGFVMQGKTIFLSRKVSLPQLTPQGNDFSAAPITAPPPVSGRIMDTALQPLAGAAIQVKGKAKGVTSDRSGWFEIEALETDILIVSFIGFEKKEINVKDWQGIVILKPGQASMGEVAVVSTGYQQLPKERATGSFTHINREMLNRSAGPDILSRLEGITNGLLFNRTVAEGENAGDYQLESRGRATIMSEAAPLIVLNNFPFEGNIRDINPNDVESITILKDAAAASIWGARAGNGVIVITTRQGAYNRRTEVSATFNTAITAKPDLFYDKQFMPSELVMKVQKEKFLRGDWADDENGLWAFSPYAELLIKRRDQHITEEAFLAEEQRMKNTDIRHDILKYLYRPNTLQQYALNINGGSSVNKYFFSVGYDKTNAAMVGNANRRLTLNLQNSFKPVEALEINAQLTYTSSKANNNAVNITSLSAGRAGLQPYERLVDENGNPVQVERTVRRSVVDNAASLGLLPWQFVPINEMRMADNSATSSFMNLLGNLRYRLIDGVFAEATYQFTESRSASRNYYAPETFFARDLVNRYTQSNGTKPIPEGGILILGDPAKEIQHSGRMVLNAQKRLGEQEFALLAGAEIRQSIVETLPGTRLYNYDPNLAMGTAQFDYTKLYTLYAFSGSATIPGPVGTSNYRTDRFVSYFGNGSYTFRSKYTLSGSARWDGSNLFGVKTNQQGTLLWSAGASWNITAEDFFKVKQINYLRLRTTYGSAGNINKDVSALPVIDYAASAFRSPELERYAAITSPGNPSLRWEKVNTFNLGLDWGVLNRRINGSIEFFHKRSTDLIGDAFIPPSTGINSANYRIQAYRYNYAALNTRGIDLQVNTKNLQGKFSWETNWLFNAARDKITAYYNSNVVNGRSYIGYNRPLVVGKSISGIYALPWHGLNPSNGKVIIYENAQESSDYAGYLETLQPGEVVYAGVTNPPYYGSVLNNFSFKGFQLSVLLTWKAGYVFRRTSMFPGTEYSFNSMYHSDLLNKWQKPGDEKYTVVPAGGGINGYDANEAAVYMSSMALVSKGDHIAVQDINLNYTFLKANNKSLPFTSARIYLYIRNLGFLWKADKNSVDPISPNARYPQQIQYNMGVQIGF